MGFNSAFKGLMNNQCALLFVISVLSDISLLIRYVKSQNVLFFLVS